jgi:hypothetical protein
MKDWKRWTGWRGWVTWTLGAIAFHTYMALPWWIAKRSGWMLPRVGDYAYWEEAVAAMSAEETKFL